MYKTLYISASFQLKVFKVFYSFWFMIATEIYNYRYIIIYLFSVNAWQHFLFKFYITHSNIMGIETNILTKTYLKIKCTVYLCFIYYIM